MSKKRTFTDEQFIVAVQHSISWAGVLRLLKLKPGGGTQLTMKLLAQRLSLDITHFLGKAARRGTKNKIIKKIPLEEILIDNSTYSSTNSLKHRLFKEGLKDRKCEECGIEEWNGKVAPLELDHRNGKRNDNRFENLFILCSNCHAQTETYCGKNIGNALVAQSVGGISFKKRTV